MVLCLFASLFGCSGGGANGVGTGGSVGTGGAAGTGGAGGTGGAVGTGGTVGSGGASGAVGSGGSSGGGSGGTTAGTGGGTGGGAGGKGGGAAGANGAGGTLGGTGGTGGAVRGRVRSIVPFDAGWLFFQGSASGAEQSSFADSSWRTVNVPHDWAIEGPFSQTAATSGRGGYVPSGIGWYRKHFTLPQSLSGRRVFVEFDGVMENSDVYVNGTHYGHHPYGWVSFRYDITASVTFGSSENVMAVKTDTTTQPAERYYAGAGIYRHVRIVAASPVHVDQWATFVTTPSPTTTAATVHVTTIVVNAGTTSQSVTVQGVVSDAGGATLPSVTTAAQTIAAGAAAGFTFDVPVANPKLWNLTTPNMYQLLTNVQVGGVTVDDDLTSFGIRSLTFDGTSGMSLNGKTVKFQGVANHQDFHGLGVAAPQRAVQRRLAQLKLLGVNAIRPSHNPPSPDFLELCDRMGILVLDEFTDVWAAHKYTDAGDYAAYFNQTATSPTGMPAVPSVATGAKWWQVDFTGWVMRDRNHPSVALYSLGNEIHDSHAARLPIVNQMLTLSHTLDPSRKDTQALLDPATAGDIDLHDQPADHQLSGRCVGEQLRHHVGRRRDQGVAADGFVADGDGHPDQHLEHDQEHRGAHRRVHVDRRRLSGRGQRRLADVRLDRRDHGRDGDGEDARLLLANDLGSAQDHRRADRDGRDQGRRHRRSRHVAHRPQRRRLRQGGHLERLGRCRQQHDARDVRHQRSGDHHRRRQRQHDRGDVPRKRPQRLPGTGLCGRSGDRRRSHHGDRLGVGSHRRERHHPGRRRHVRPLLRLV